MAIVTLRELDVGHGERFFVVPRVRQSSVNTTLADDWRKTGTE
jgi:hypothetical protein